MRTAQIRIINEVVPIIIEEDMIKKEEKRVLVECKNKENVDRRNVLGK